MRRSDPLILGGGPAGSAAAIMLARGGARPLIIERSLETGDALCGGFISWQSCATLERLGLDRATLGGHPITKLRLFSGGLHASAALPKPAISLSRQRLDTLLLERAVAYGAGLHRGVAVREIDDAMNVRLADSTTLSSESLFLATGKYDVRGAARARDTATTLGLRLLIPPHPALRAMIGGAIELHLFDGGYCGAVINERGEANLCMAVGKSRLADAGGSAPRLIEQIGHENPALGERIAFARDVSTEAIGAIPYGWIAGDSRPGLFRLGDQAAVIPSLAGEGNGIALASAIRAAAAWHSGGALHAQPFQRAFARTARRPVTIAMWLWRLSETRLAAATAIRLVGLAPQIATQLSRMTRIDS